MEFSFGALNFTNNVIKRLTDQGKISDLLDVFYNSIVKSFDSITENSNKIHVEIIKSQLRGQSNIKSSLKEYLNSTVSNANTDLDKFSEQKFIDEIKRIIEENFDFTLNDLESGSLKALTSEALKKLHENVIYSLSDLQWSYILFNQNGDVLDKLNLNNDLLNTIFKVIDEIQKNIIQDSDEKKDSSESKIKKAISRHMEIYANQFLNEDIRNYYVEPFADIIYDYSTQASNIPLFDIMFQRNLKVGEQTFYDCYDPKIWFFNGEPGVGKSSSIYKFVSELNPTIQAAILIELDKCDTVLNSNSKIIQICLDELTINNIEFSEILNQYKDLFIIFDGLDEFNFHDREHISILNEFQRGLEDFLKKSSDYFTKILIFGRPNSIEILQKKESIVTFIDPLVSYDFKLGEKKEKEFDNREVLLEKLGLEKDKELCEFVLCDFTENQFPITQYPVLLVNLLRIYTEVGNDVKNKILQTTEKFELYSIISKFYFNREKSKRTSTYNSLPEFFKIFSQIAYSGWKNGEVKLIPIEKVKNDLNSDLDIVGIASSHYIELFNDKGYFELKHKSFGEFFTAKYFIEEFKKITSETFDKESYLSKFYDLFKHQQITKDQADWIFSGMKVEIRNSANDSDFLNFKSFYDFVYRSIFEGNIENFNLPISHDINIINGIFNLLIGVISFIIPIFRSKKIPLHNLKTHNNEVKVIEKWIYLALCYDYKFLDVIKNDMQGIVLHRIVMTHNNLNGSYFLGCHLSHVDISESTLDFSNFSFSLLDWCNLTLCRCKKGNFESLIVRNSNLSFAIFKDANFNNADFTDSILNETDLSGSDFSNVRNLTPQQLSTVKSLKNVKGIDKEIIKETLKYPNLKVSLRVELEELLNN